MDLGKTYMHRLVAVFQQKKKIRSVAIDQKKKGRKEKRDIYDEVQHPANLMEPNTLL